VNQKSPISKNDWWFAIGIGSGDTGNAEELTRAYGNFCHAAKIRPLASPHITSTTPSAQLQPSLLRHVRHGTLLHNLLSATSGGLFRSIVPILYLNIITWYYQHHYNAAQSNADELAQLRRLMHKARSAKSTTALLWFRSQIPTHIAFITRRQPGFSIAYSVSSLDFLSVCS
jgi:hypothetical protein